jgi:hypothetical protein
MSWNHVRTVICSELFNHCQRHNLNDNGTVPGVLLVQFPGLIRVQIDYTGNIQDEQKSESPRNAFWCQKKRRKILLSTSRSILKRGSYKFELIIKCLWSKIRYLHKLC